MTISIFKNKHEDYVVRQRQGDGFRYVKKSSACQHEFCNNPDDAEKHNLVLAQAAADFLNRSEITKAYGRGFEVKAV